MLPLRVPDLRNALLAAKAAGYDHVIVDGLVIETDRVRTPGPTKDMDLQWSGKIHNHGGNVQVASAPDDGWPLWVSGVRPGREHDTTALRASGALPVLAEWVADGGEILTDLGYEGLSDQIAVPSKKPKGTALPDDQKQHDRVHNALRAVGERANALVILHIEHGRTT